MEYNDRFEQSSGDSSDEESNNNNNNNNNNNRANECDTLSNSGHSEASSGGTRD